MNKTENPYRLNEKQFLWIKKTRDKILAKEAVVARRSSEKMPYTTVDGIFDDKFSEKSTWWTNSFWTGILWLLYAQTKETCYREQAEQLERRLDAAFHCVDELHHDIGFLWLLSAVANYRITGTDDSKTRGLLAAHLLAARFNPCGGFITAWNGKEKEGYSIIDTMMNLPLLFWAEKETGSDRFGRIARIHADKTAQNAVRADGSIVHMIEYSVEDGHVIQTLAGQGYQDGSSWTRGQAWAIYGFALSAMYTNNSDYLNTAKKAANYFLAAAAAWDYLPPIDFRAPDEPRWSDATAGAIAASGLITLSRLLDKAEGRIYLDGALKLLCALESKCADFSEDCDALLHMGSEAYRAVSRKHVDLIYGDYFFIEAIFKLYDDTPAMW